VIKKICCVLFACVLFPAIVFAQIDLQSDGSINRNYQFHNTKVLIRSESEFQKIAVEYLKPLLEGKGWTVTLDEEDTFDLITMPLFKEHGNFQGTGQDYLTMNLYFFKPKEEGDDVPVIDAFVSKRIVSRDIRAEIKTMCFEIMSRIPIIKKIAPRDDLVVPGLFPEQ